MDTPDTMDTISAMSIFTEPQAPPPVKVPPGPAVVAQPKRQQIAPKAAVRQTTSTTQERRREGMEAKKETEEQRMVLAQRPMDTQIVPAMGRDIAILDPDVSIAEARHAARAIMGVLATKKKKIFFNGEQYMAVEDWVLLGRWYGVTAQVVTTEPVSICGHSGFRAIAEAVDRNGIIRSRAEAYCLDDEENWGERNKYEWHYKLKAGGTCKESRPPIELVWERNTKTGKSFPVKERVLVGVERVPLFQLASKAQTTACAKVLRNLFSFVAVIAGCSATPAEEMVGFPQDPGEEDEAPPQNITQPQPVVPTAGGLRAKMGITQGVHEKEAQDGR